MRARTIGAFLFVCCASAWSASAGAQAAGTIVLYSETNYGGRTYTVNRERDNIRLLWQVRSARIGTGRGWQLCTLPRFQGCTSVNANNPNMRMVVISARQLPEPPAPNASLRGMASEFFRAPRDNRGRIVSCASGAAQCAAESADRFCRSRGWTAASFHLQETVARQNYLADVLCTRTGR